MFWWHFLKIIEQLYFPHWLLRLLFLLSAYIVIFAVPTTMQDCLYYLEIKKNEVVIHAKTWMNLNIMLNGRSHAQRLPTVWFHLHEMFRKGKCIETENTGLAKKFLRFLSKNKRHFSCSPRTLLNNVFTILFHYLLPFFRQLHNSIFPKLFIFLSKELFQVPFTVFQGNEIFPIKRILQRLT